MFPPNPNPRFPKSHSSTFHKTQSLLYKTLKKKKIHFLLTFFVNSQPTNFPEPPKTVKYFPKQQNPVIARCNVIFRNALLLTGYNIDEAFFSTNKETPHFWRESAIFYTDTALSSPFDERGICIFSSLANTRIEIRGTREKRARIFHRDLFPGVVCVRRSRNADTFYRANKTRRQMLLSSARSGMPFNAHLPRDKSWAIFALQRSRNRHLNNVLLRFLCGKKV